MTPNDVSRFVSATPSGDVPSYDIEGRVERVESPRRPQSGASTPASLAGMLWPRRLRLILWMVAAMLVFGVWAILVPKRWEAKATLMPPDQTSSAGGALQGALAAKSDQFLGAIASDMLGVHNPTYVLMGILGSETVERQIVDKFDLRHAYGCKLVVDAEKILKQHTDIEDVRLSGMITIRVTDSDPVRARDMVEAYVDAANRLVAQLTTSSAHRERMFLEDRLRSIKDDLDASSLALSQFSSRTGTLNPEAQGRAMLTASAELQGHLIAAEADLRGLEQIYAPDNAHVRSAAARVAELRGEFNRMAGTAAPARGYPAAGAGPELYPSMRELPLLDNTYENLYRRTEVEEAVYEALTKQYEIAKVQEAKEIPSVRLLDVPRVPERKSWPPRTLMVMLGGMLGFIAAALSVWMETASTALDEADPRRAILNRIAGFTASWPWRRRQYPIANEL